MGERRTDKFPTRVYIQNFTARQILSKKALTILFKKDRFTKLSEPGFSFDSRLVCLIESDTIKFKVLRNLKMIFNIADYYEEATDKQVRVFCTHPMLNCNEISEILDNTNQSMRKLITAILKEKVLDTRKLATIQKSADSLDIELKITDDGKIVLPTEKRELHNFLCFLHENLYKGSLTQKRYMTNSKRPA